MKQIRPKIRGKIRYSHYIWDLTYKRLYLSLEVNFEHASELSVIPHFEGREYIDFEREEIPF